MKLVYPFSAIVGQGEMKLALMLAAVDQGIGGVLIFGDRGTGKSTAVRALAALLPKKSLVMGCQYNCTPQALAGLCERCTDKPKEPKAQLVPTPVVDLPLGATEDRVIGALDIERALSAGEKHFEPGLLARAHGGFLYIDEVNLLEDHLVDLLLDVTASGENVVEREGMSIRHPARFVLVGSGNPEEGELRPQLLDRFGLCLEVRTPMDLATRVEVVRRREDFERDRTAFVEKWQREEQKVRSAISRARTALPDVETPPQTLEKAVELSMALGADGLRGELTLIRAARAAAALERSREVTQDHLRKVAVLAMRHRLRKAPTEEIDSGLRVERALSSVLAA
jgi:magnesium chelatase subunit I